MTVSILAGDSHTTLQTLASGTARCIVTSPPYYALRDYGVDGQIGLEQSPEAYIARLVDVFRECRRVLTDDGTLWVNIGDSYWGGKGQSAHGNRDRIIDRLLNGDTCNYPEQEVGRRGWVAPRDGKHPTIKPKDLIGIPWMLAFALRDDGWFLRQEIIWHKPNPMPESVQDRFVRSHEQIFLFSKSRRYYFDHDAILEPANFDGRKQTTYRGGVKSIGNPNHSRRKERWTQFMPDGRPARSRRDVWSIPHTPNKESHFATYSTNLIEPCILAGSQPGDTVLDPFNGTGTTGEAALLNSRNYIGLELNRKYVNITRKRLAAVQQVAL